jgi:hypothetical protein
VVDPAAGTGRSTWRLVARFARVTAVEPAEAMRRLGGVDQRDRDAPAAGAGRAAPRGRGLVPEAAYALRLSAEVWSTRRL